MRCPKCQSENREERRFCADCGEPLAVVCPDCGFANEPKERFCGGCGAEREGPADTQDNGFGSPRSYTPAHLTQKIFASRSAMEGERKHVTVLFADIKGSLELIEGRDPEDVQTLLDSAIRSMMNAVHRYEGTVNRVQGDGIMAIFGAPLAHEDHAVRACYAALAMQEDQRRKTAKANGDDDVEVKIRVGLNSGDVVVRAIGNDLSMDYDAIGQTSHLAARMEQLAAPGTIQLTESTRRLAEEFVQVESLGPTAVKGLKEPVELFRLTGATLTRTRFQASLARGPGPASKPPWPAALPVSSAGKRNTICWSARGRRRRPETVKSSPRSANPGSASRACSTSSPAPLRLRVGWS
jgi:class 3 adenylate cyclase